MRRKAAALLLLLQLLEAPFGAACSRAQAASAFEVIPREPAPPHPHRAAYALALAGAGLIASSFPLADEADRRYRAYLAETDPTQIDQRFAATTRMDRLSSGALLTGQALLATAIYLRFLRHPADERVTLSAGPSRCALALHF